MANDAQQDYPLLRYLDGIGQIIQRVDDLAADTPAGPGWSQILDINRCPSYALPWLAQFVGVRFQSWQDTDLQQRQAIIGEPGFARGTPAALVSAAQRYLNPWQTLTIFEQDTSAYHFTVVISAGQLGTASYAWLAGQYSTYTALDGAFGSYASAPLAVSEVEAALLAAKPAGLQMTVNVVTADTYSEADGDFATYSALEAAFSTYALFDVYTG